MTRAEAEDICGGFSRPSKMPGHGYSLPASACQTGGKLIGIKGAVCHSCYARKGRYAFKNVQPALERRLASLDHPLWLDAMASLLWRDVGAGRRWFRFHDSGDLQSPSHLDRILTLAKAVPDMSFWLPTLETRMVGAALFSGGCVPPNMNVRLSTPLVDGSPTPLALELVQARPGVTLSRVATRGSPEVEGWHECPAVKHKTGKCGECRACWDRSTRGVVYYKH